MVGAQSACVRNVLRDSLVRSAIHLHGTESKAAEEEEAVPLVIAIYSPIYCSVFARIFYWEKRNSYKRFFELSRPSWRPKTRRKVRTYFLVLGPNGFDPFVFQISRDPRGDRKFFVSVLAIQKKKKRAKNKQNKLKAIESNNKK